MSQLNNNNNGLRALQMGEENIICLTISPQYLLWCSYSGSKPMLYMWKSNEENPYTNPLVELGFTPILISLFQEKIIILGETAVALFTLERISNFIDNNNKEEEIEEEEVTIIEEFICSDSFWGVSHLSWTPDGTIVAASSPQNLILINCRIGNNNNNNNNNDIISSLILHIDCTNWYGEPGVAFTALSSTRLFLISKTNHIISIRYNENNFNEELILERDGHILTRVLYVTCFTIGGSEEGHLIIGLSDGSIKLLQQDSLEVFFSLDLTKKLYGIKETLQINKKNQKKEENNKIINVLNVIVGKRLITVIRPDAVTFYDKNSIDILLDKTIFLSGEIPDLSECAENGSWCMYSLKRRELLYYNPFINLNDKNQIINDDIIHAQVPLPLKILEPLLLPYQKKISIQETSKKKIIEKNKIIEKPVTNGHPIKSSGYASSVPWSIQQSLKQKQKQHEKSGNLINSSLLAPLTLKYKSLPIIGHPFQSMTTANKILSSSPVHSAIINSAIFSAGGTALLTASGDTTANWLKYPIAKNGGDGILMRSHTNSVNSIDVNLSINKPIVVTGSDDGIISVWQPFKRESPYIKHVVGKEIRVVKFFYTDKFISYISGNSINLCKYALDEGGGELHRIRNESKLESVLEIKIDSTQHLSYMDSINYFTSNIIVWAGSNKSIGIYDIAAEQHIQIIEEAHTRPIHHISMMTASRHASPSINLLHLYVTAGLDNSARVWDLRQPRAIRQFSLHRNSAGAVGVAVSPDGALLAIGSEGGAGSSTTNNNNNNIGGVCMYDVGAGALVGRVSSPTATALCWHPTESVLAMGTSRGTLQLTGQR